MPSEKQKPPLFCLVDTESTVLQKQTEKECQPYFVNLSKLPADQKGHLQRIGLLKAKDNDDGDDNNDGNNDGNNDTDGNDNDNGNHDVQLLRDKHMRYLEGVWKNPLKAPFVSLDSSRPWMLYWCLHGYDLLTSHNRTSSLDWITDVDGSSMVSTLEDCWQGYHTPALEIPEIVDLETDDFYGLPHEDDEAHETDNGKEVLYYCGGFGGGPGQMAHAATTYAAVLALCILATSKGENLPPSSDNKDDNDNADDEDDYRSLHYSDRARRILSEIRIPLYRWMASLQVPSTGGYRMQHDGEVDVRATYTIACCSKLLGLLNKTSSNNKQEEENPSCSGFTVLGRPRVIEFVQSCQTYEGGMGGEPFSEAHGGYTFCAVAALKLLGALGKNSNNSNNSNFDVATLLGWLGRRQLPYEGGFSGRSNKLVDGCYSFWQGGATAIASSCSEFLTRDNDEESIGHDDDNDDDPWLAQHRRNLQQQETTTTTTAAAANSTTTTSLPFPLLYDVFLLERYILLCAQEVTGGLRDKPSKPRDFYHTCYNLSGLSIAQYCSSNSTDDNEEEEDAGFGDPQQTLVGQTHPCYNIRIDRVAAILDIDWEKE